MNKQPASNNVAITPVAPDGTPSIRPNITTIVLVAIATTPNKTVSLPSNVKPAFNAAIPNIKAASPSNKIWAALYMKKGSVTTNLVAGS